MGTETAAEPTVMEVATKTCFFCDKPGVVTHPDGEVLCMECAQVVDAFQY
jgi:hypothetical protein